jgi:hypothetical protein
MSTSISRRHSSYLSPSNSSSSINRNNVTTITSPQHSRPPPKRGRLLQQQRARAIAADAGNIRSHSVDPTSTRLHTATERKRILNSDNSMFVSF